MILCVPLVWDNQDPTQVCGLRKKSNGKYEYMAYHVDDFTVTSSKHETFIMNLENSMKSQVKKSMISSRNKY